MDGQASCEGPIDGGCTFALTADMQPDFRCNFRVTDSAPDFQPFASLSIRF